MKLAHASQHSPNMFAQKDKENSDFNSYKDMTPEEVKKAKARQKSIYERALKEKADHSHDVPLHRESTLDYGYDHTTAWSSLA